MRFLGFNITRGSKEISKELAFPITKEVKGQVPTGLVSEFRIGVRLTADELLRMYVSCSAVRSAIDIIAGIASSASFVVDNEYIKTFLSGSINANGETFRAFCYKVFVDLLLYDISFVELVRNTSDQVVEMYVRDPRTFKVERDEHGVITKITQSVLGGTEVEFSPGEIEMMVLHPCSAYPFGVPILESVAGEVAALMMLQDSLANEANPGNVPPGILHLGRLGDDEYARAKTVISNVLTSDAPLKIALVRNLTNVEWIPLRGELSAMRSYDAISYKSVEAIASAFGIPAMLLTHQNVYMYTFIVQDWYFSLRYIKPLWSLVEKLINEKVAPSYNIQCEFKFVKPVNSLDTGLLKFLVDSGVISKEELRNMLGLPPKIKEEQTGFNLV